MFSTAALNENPDGAAALAGIGLPEDGTAPAPDLALFFASPLYEDLPAIVAQAYQRSAASIMVGCSGQGVVGIEKEVEGRPGLSLLSLALPGTEFFPKRVETKDIANLESPESWRQWLGAPQERINAWIVLADPFTFDSERFINGLAAAYPDRPIVGGLASGSPNERHTSVFLNGQVHESGAVVVGIGGAFTVRSVVAQGAMPIGHPWTITSVEREVITSIGNRPATTVLQETIDGLAEDVRERATRNLLVGLALDEYKDELHQGDFLIRNLMGIDPRSGAIAINAIPSVGQTMQFQIRDAEAADEDLRRQLAEVREELAGVETTGALLCTCNGRGTGLFGTADHDAHAVAEALGQLPLSGFFCNGEIGPVGGRPFLHGFTASLALFIPKTH
ncbi:MAG: hypothetical protein EXR58_00905 [Chloroflexi bacterium]|nr:hypothetical protein [Chloroflexota bacterium]